MYKVTLDGLNAKTHLREMQTHLVNDKATAQLLVKVFHECDDTVTSKLSYIEPLEKEFVTAYDLWREEQ